MKYIKIIDSENYIYPYDIKNIKIDFPNTSFSNNSNLNEWNIFPVMETPKPENLLKNYNESVSYVNNQWVISWIEVDKSPEEIKAMKINELNQQKQIDLQNLLTAELLDKAQKNIDNTEAVKYKNLYPLWDDKDLNFEFEKDYKVNYIDQNYNIRLFKCMTKHNKQLNNAPTIDDSLWSEII